MANKVGWIGLGRMGEAMVKRLTKAGHGVDIWNRTRSKAEQWAERYGGTIADTSRSCATPTSSSPINEPASSRGLPTSGAPYVIFPTKHSPNEYGKTGSTC